MRRLGTALLEAMARGIPWHRLGAVGRGVITEGEDGVVTRIKDAAMGRQDSADMSSENDGRLAP